MPTVGAIFNKQAFKIMENSRCFSSYLLSHNKRFHYGVVCQRQIEFEQDIESNLPVRILALRQNKIVLFAVWQKIIFVKKDVLRTLLLHRINLFLT